MDSNFIYQQFLEDIKKSVINEFKQYDVILNNDEDTPSILLHYVNWRRRFIGQYRRTVIYSKEIKQNKEYLKYKKIIDKIEYKLKNAEDITAFLSKGILESPYITDSKSGAKDKDTLLNSFNIHHLHLGDCYLEKDKLFDINFVSRTNELLFLLIQVDKVYFLDILGHDFYNENLFKVIKNNWHDLIEPYKLNGVLINDNVRENIDKKQLLNAGVSIMVELDNEVYAFCETTTSGHNFNDVRDVDWLFEVIKELSELLANNKASVLRSINKLVHMDINSFDYEIVIENGLLVFFEKISKTILRYNPQSKKIRIYKEYAREESFSFVFNK